MTAPLLADVAKTPFYELEDLLADPKLLSPPKVVVPCLTFAGRLTLFAAGEKMGKSTIASQAAAACVKGASFFGMQVAQCPVLVLSLDEPIGDLVRRLARNGLTGGVVVYDECPSFDELEAMIRAKDIGLTIIDTALEFVAGRMDDPNSAMQWQPILKALRGIAQRTDSSILLLHHMSRGTNRYADSRQLGAGVDQIVEMVEGEGDPALRKLRIRGRSYSGALTIRYVNGQYDIDLADLPTDKRVLRSIESNPGIVLTKLRNVVGGKGTTVDDVVRDLISRGLVEDRGNDERHAYYCTLAKFTADSGGAVSLDGQLRTDGGHAPGQGPVPAVQAGQPQKQHPDRGLAGRISVLGQQGSGAGQDSGQLAPVPNPYIWGSGTGVIESVDTPSRSTPELAK